MNPCRIWRSGAALLLVLVLACGSRADLGQSSTVDEGQGDNLADVNMDLWLTDADNTAAVTATLNDMSLAAPPANCQCSQEKGPLTTCCLGCNVNWSDLPWVCPMPRPGDFPNPPNTCGYFTFMDWLRGDFQAKRPPSGYPPFALMPPSFFDADFRYVDKKNYADRTFVEKLKRIQLNDCMMFSTGGNAYVRFMNETNSRLTEANNHFALPRFRTYGDLMFGDVARVYGEYIWADNIGADLPPLPGEINRGDILNLFLDVNVLEWDNHPVVTRVGRQELLLGSQRLVTTLDWANTRRTFEGVRVFRRGEKWDVDAFWVQFVPPLPGEFDRPDENRDFAGAWLTYRPEKGELLDLYYLYANDTNTVTRQQIEESPREVNTFGSRWTGDECGYLWDFEGAVQFGDRAGRDLVAGMGTAGVGRHMKDVWATPTVWVYYDYASGDNDPGVGTSNTFDQLYPFGHYYLGWLDLVARQNIHDANAHVFFYPTEWTTVWLQYHHFWLAEETDALYNAGGVPYRRDPTGQAGNNVGDEMDIILNFHLTNYSDLLFGYSRLFGGGFLEGTAGPNRAADADVVHFMYQLKW